MNWLRPDEASSEPKARATGAATSAPATASALPPSELHPPVTAPQVKGGPVWLLVSALLLAVLLLSFPTVPAEKDADTSLGAVLDYAHSHQKQFGTELVCTYGPLGFLTFPGCAPYRAVARMAVDVALCFTVASGLCLLAWRLGRFQRGLLLLTFCWAAANIQPGPDLIFEVGLLSWGLLALLSSGRRWAGCVGVFILLAAFCALSKVSVLFVAGLGVGLVALDAGLREWRAALLAAGSFLACFTLGWLGSGQHLENLLPFVRNGLRVARAYNAALGLEAPASVVHAAVALLLLLGLIGLLRSVAGFQFSEPRLQLRRWCLPAIVALFALASWKHGLVRGDPFHVVLFFGLVPVLVLALESMGNEPRPLHRWARGLGLLACVIAAATLQTVYFVPLPASLLQPARGLLANLASLSHPATEWHQLATAADKLRAQAQLPECRRRIGQAPVDVFGQNQAYAPFNDLNYSPRPVCQSYSACSAPLMQLNEARFLSDDAAPWMLFELQAIDRKFPSLEDAWLLRDLLVNAELVTREGPVLLLKKTSAAGPRLELLAEGTLRVGERLELGRYGNTNLWLELHLKPTVAGRVRQLLYRPSLIRLAAWAEPGKLLYRHQAAASMLSAGFLASPLLRSTEDVVSWFSTNALPRPQAYTVEPAEGDFFWQPSAQFRVYRLSSSSSPAQASGAKAAPAFTVFRNVSWHPGEAPPSAVGEALSYAVFVLLPVCAAVGLVWFARRLKRRGQPARWPQLVLGNALVLALFTSLLLLGLETYYRFCYDATDAVGYTKVCQRWVQRHWHVNRAGCRDDIEYSPAVTPGRRRISFLGDSFTAGHGIKRVEDRFANQLRGGHPETEIHLLANVGLDTGAEILLLKRLAARGYQFDQVVLVYCLNDIGDLVDDQSAAVQQMRAIQGQGGWLTANSYALNLFYDHYLARQNPYLRDYGRFVREAYRGPLWEKQKQRLQELREAVEAHGGHLAVMTFPFLDTLGPQYPYAFVHAQLDQFWQEQHVPHLDLLPVFKDLPARALVVNAYDAHPNEYANQLAARALEPFLFGTQAPQAGK